MPAVRAVRAAGDRAAARCAMSASRSRSWSPTAPALAEDALEAIEVDIEPLPAVSDRERRARATLLLFEATGTNHIITLTASRGDAEAAFASARLYPPRALRGAAPHRGADGAARAAGGMGRSMADGSPSTAPPRCAFPNRRMLARQMGLPEDIDQHDRERRRRRLRRARRVLSGGFPDPVRRAPTRPAGEMDRGPPRASGRHQSRARGRVRARDRLRARRHDPRRCAATPRPTSAPISAPTARPRARNIAQVLSGPYRIPQHPHRRRRCWSPTRRRSAPIAGRAGSRPISSASGCSTWRRAISGSTASNSAGAI